MSLLGIAGLNLVHSVSCDNGSNSLQCTEYEIPGFKGFYLWQGLFLGIPVFLVVVRIASVLREEYLLPFYYKRYPERRPKEKHGRKGGHDHHKYAASQVALGLSGDLLGRSPL